MPGSLGGTGMTRLSLLAMAIILSSGPFTAKALGQGAVEYSITTSHAAGATANGGTALGKAVQQLAGRLQQKVSKSNEPSRQTPRQLGQIPGDHPAPATHRNESAKGLEITYGPGSAESTDPRQDAGPQPPPCAPPTGKDSPKTKASQPCKAETEEKYPSIVNLSFEK